MLNPGRSNTTKFIDAIEGWAGNIPANEEVNDTVASYNKKSYIENIVKEARQLVEYNEWLVGLEIALSNLHEVGIKLSEEILQYAENALKKAPESDWFNDLHLLKNK